MLVAREVEVRAGARLLLAPSSFQVSAGDKVGPFCNDWGGGTSMDGVVGTAGAAGPEWTKAANTNIHSHSHPSSLFPTRQSRSAALGLIKSIRERKGREREYKGDGEGTGENSNPLVANPEGRVRDKGMGEVEVVKIGGIGDLEKIDRIDPSSDYYEQGEEERNGDDVEGNDDGDDGEGNDDQGNDDEVEGDEEEIDDEDDG